MPKLPLELQQKFAEPTIGDESSPWNDPEYEPPEDQPVDRKASASKGGKASAAKRKAGTAKPNDPLKGTRKPGRPRMSAKQEHYAVIANEDNLSFERKMFLDKFVFEYIQDFNSSMAWIRAGGNPNTATSMGPKSLRTAYVQQQLQTLKNQLTQDQIISSNEVILGLKREANHYGDDGSSAARVRAWGMLGKVLGLDAPKAPDDPNKGMPKGGVIEIPMAESVESWSSAAEASQLALKNDVRK